MKVQAQTDAQMKALNKSIKAKSERFDNSRESVYVKKLMEQNKLKHENRLRLVDQ